jgi:hypothetical protein
MNKPSKQQTILQQLRGLANEPEEQGCSANARLSSPLLFLLVNMSCFAPA